MADGKDMPDELLVEILARMPVKSLIKFTCVCKSWLSLIKSPEFAAKQYATRTLSLSQQNRHDCHIFLSFSSQCCTPVGEVVLRSYETLDISTRFECKPVNTLLEFGRGYPWFFHGPCNGIFCVQMRKGGVGESFLLWNPSTRQVFKPAQCKSARSRYRGFGFDANANDYKIIAFHCHSKRGPHRIQLYSLSCNSWRDVEDSPLTFGPRKSLLEGKRPSSNGRMCNWLGLDNSVSDVCFLFSFDMGDEVFIETPVPDGVVNSVLHWSFVQQRSHLLYPAIVSYGLDNSCSKVTYVNVWVLHEYGAAGYWTKQLSVVLPDHIIVAQPKGFWKEEQMLFINDRKERVLTCYNLITQELKTVDSVQVDTYEQLYGYAESLYSIQTSSQQLGEDEDSDHGPDYCFCEVNQPLCANICIFEVEQKIKYAPKGHLITKYPPELQFKRLPQLHSL